jgi:hypothetical protein
MRCLVWFFIYTQYLTYGAISLAYPTLRSSTANIPTSQNLFPSIHGTNATYIDAQERKSPSSMEIHTCLSVTTSPFSLWIKNVLHVFSHTITLAYPLITTSTELPDPGSGSNSLTYCDPATTHLSIDSIASTYSVNETTQLYKPATCLHYASR